MFCWFKNILGIFLLLLLLSIFSCGRESKPAKTVRLGGTYRIPAAYHIGSLDPISGDIASWTIGSQIYEGLLTYSSDETRIIPLLAERYITNDLAVQIHLRKGVKFHDAPCFAGGKGRELTAADVKYSFERTYQLNAPAGELSAEAFLGYEEFVKGRSSHIEGFKVLDKYIFEIRLTKPDPDLLSSLTNTYRVIVPQEAVEFYGDDFKWHPVGTGPFRFLEIEPNKKLVLAKNENYWGYEGQWRLPYLDGIEYIFYSPEEDEKMFLDFQTGRIDECTSAVSQYLRDLVEPDPQGNLLFKGWLRENGVQFVKDKVFRKLRYLQVEEENKKVRQAMGYAVNRKRLIAKHANIFTNYEIAKGPIPSSVIYFNRNLAGQYYDPSLARKLLEEAGFPQGKGLPEYPFISLPGPDADFIAEDLEAVGFKIKKTDPFPAWRELLERNEPLLVRLININTTPNAYNILEALPKAACLTDALFIRAFQDWQENEASYKNKALLNRLEEIIIDIAPVVFLYHIDGEFRFLQSNVRGRQLGNAWGDKLHHVWLDDETNK